jgi:hypothetical protein
MPVAPCRRAWRGRRWRGCEAPRYRRPAALFIWSLARSVVMDRAGGESLMQCHSRAAPICVEVVVAVAPSESSASSEATFTSNSVLQCDKIQQGSQTRVLEYP